MRRSVLYAAVTLSVCGLSATARFGQWSLEQPGDFIFALSSKRVISFDDRTATSEIAFVCNQENKHVAVLLIPLDGTFTSRHKATPRYHPEDRRPIWPVGLDATLGKRTGLHIFGIARRAGGTCLVPKGQRSRCVKSVHFYFPNDLDANTQTTNHMVVDVAGFSSGVAAFASRCERAQ
jgi:hypothetical protein